MRKEPDLEREAKYPRRILIIDFIIEAIHTVCNSTTRKSINFNETSCKFEKSVKQQNVELFLGSGQ